MFNYNKQISIKNLDDEFSALSEEVEKFKLPAGFGQFILYALSELFVNVQEHSKAKKISIFFKLQDKNKFFLQISDNGIGLRKSYLCKEVYPKDDFAAIQFALNGLSTKNSKERGFGLYTIKKFIGDLNGIMTITSGKGLVQIVKDSLDFKNLPKAKQGVEIMLKSKIKPVDFYKNIE